MKNTIINHKKYQVQRVSNSMQDNFEFIDKHNVIHLVDSGDVSAFAGAYECYYELDGTDTDGTKWYLCTTHDQLAPSQDAPCAKWVNDPIVDENTAIAYAKEMSMLNDEGIFWWKAKKECDKCGQELRTDEAGNYYHCNNNHYF